VTALLAIGSFLGVIFGLVIAHELGHVLGLGDDVICCKQDLMNAFPLKNNVSALPTTLDLYALHVLATANSIPSFVWLSNEIPYGTALPAPKFNGSPSMIRVRPPDSKRKKSLMVHVRITL